MATILIHTDLENGVTLYQDNLGYVTATKNTNVWMAYKKNSLGLGKVA